MLQPQEGVLVCVSGGKDSLVLWNVLHELGYRTRAMYIDLGLGEYSARSKEKKGLLPEEGLRALEGFVRQSG
jgi:tRNA(Ile)-lysidine synthase TilS/MesJ